MKVYKIYDDTGMWYQYSGNNQEEAEKDLFDYIGEFQPTKVEEVPESEWDKKDIMVKEDIYDDEDESEDMFSIRDLIMPRTPTLISTNDNSLW